MLVLASPAFSKGEVTTSPMVKVPATIFDPDRNPDRDIEPDYAALFNDFDAQQNNGDALSFDDNTSGSLAWGQSYMQLAYVNMYLATSNTRYLDKMVTQFDRVLARRDDRLKRVDAFAQKPLKGWGCSNYDKQRRWHVFVAHTGMICKAPAEFVRRVKEDPALSAKYGPTADRYLAELEAIVADANRDYRTSGTVGYFIDPSLGDGGIIPLNMSNAMGSVIVELYRATGKPVYKAQATELANFFRGCLQTDGFAWNWEYWPRNPGEPVKRGEDISHAAVNVDFASRCYRAEIVFTRKDMQKFHGTWIRVAQGNGSKSGYADFVDGTEDPDVNYMPQAAGRWLALSQSLSPKHAQTFGALIQPAFSGQELIRPSQALGLSYLARLKPAP